MIAIKDDPRFTHIKIATRLQRIDDALVAADEALNTEGHSKAVGAVLCARFLVANLKTLVLAAGEGEQ